MGATDILQVAQGLAAGATITLVGINGNVVNVTDAGFLESIDQTVRDTVNHATYGNEQIFNALGAGGSVGVDLDTLLSRLSATRASYLDELDFGLNERLGTPAGASLAVDIAANQTDLNSLLVNLITVDTVVDNIQVDLSNATDGLGALKTLIDENQTDLNTTLSNLATVDTVVDGIQTDLDNAADGLGKIATELSGAATSSSYSYTADTNEQTLLEISQTNIYSIMNFWADLSAFTSARIITARVYAKIDGVNYIKLDEMNFVIGTHDSISIPLQANLNHNWKITIQIDTVEAGAITVPIRYVLSDFT